MRLRLLLALAAAALLGACNMVTTVNPMFPPSAEREQLRDGGWATTDAPCQFSDAAPVKDWQICVGATQIKGDHITLWDPQGHNRSDVDVIWTKGPPPVAQVLMRFDPQKDPSEPDHLNVYGGFEEKKRDAQGRAVEIEAWTVLCGPPRTPSPVSPSTAFARLRISPPCAAQRWPVAATTSSRSTCAGSATEAADATGERAWTGVGSGRQGRYAVTAGHGRRFMAMESAHETPAHLHPAQRRRRLGPGPIGAIAPARRRHGVPIDQWPGIAFDLPARQCVGRQRHLHLPRRRHALRRADLRAG